MSALEAAQSRPDPARSASISFSALAPRASSTPGKTREIPNPSDCESEEEMDESSLLDKSSQDFKVSSDTLEFFREKFTTTTSNEVRRQWRSRFGRPKVDVASAPIMDKMVKSRLHPATKSRDKALSKQQALLLDAVGPLTYVLEEAGKETLTVQATVEACQQALAFIGNANMHLNRERRRNAILCMNRDLAEIAEDDDTFKTSAPQLFGDGFSRKAKERSEELKCLSQAASSRGGKASTGSFVRGAEPTMPHGEAIQIGAVSIRTATGSDLTAETSTIPSSTGSPTTEVVRSQQSEPSAFTPSSKGNKEFSKLLNVFCCECSPADGCKRHDRKCRISPVPDCGKSCNACTKLECNQLRPVGLEMYSGFTQFSGFRSPFNLTLQER